MDQTVEDAMGISVSAKSPMRSLVGNWATCINKRVSLL